MSYFSQRGATGPIPYAGTSTDASLASLVGSKFETSDGREFVLVQNAGTALVQGKMVQGPAQITNHSNLTTTTAAVGATTVTVTLGGTLVTANQYAGGYFIVNAGTGIGQQLKIASHPAQSSSSGTVVITLEDPIQVATLASDTKSCLRMNPFGSSNGTDVRTDGVIVCPTTVSGQVLGVAAYPIAASTSTVPTYGLVQSKGIANVLNDASTTIGVGVMPSSNTAGAVMTYVVATSTLLGFSVQAGVTTEARQVQLNIA